jgi:hypothetical protein
MDGKVDRGQFLQFRTQPNQLLYRFIAKLQQLIEAWLQERSLKSSIYFAADRTFRC